MVIRMKKIGWIIVFFFLAAAGIIGVMSYRKNEGIRFVREMGSGINIGNTLDVTRVREHKKNAGTEYYETFWGNPAITKELFAMIKEEGFQTVRLPVSWDEHLDNRYRIDTAWMDRVAQVVEYALEEDLYVILDTHHESWLVPQPDEADRTENILCTLWQQIAERFAGYTERLVFEGMNEPRTVDSEAEWKGGTPQERKIVNHLNAAFVETVRAVTGNEKRWLIVTPYGGNSGKTALMELELPQDNRLIVAVHAYIPYGFAMNEAGTDAWNADNVRDTEEIQEVMQTLNKLFVRKGVPVILTEFGCMDKKNPGAREAWAQYYTQYARENNIAYIWWDEGGKCRLMDRENYRIKEPEIVKILVGE